ncbi:hypothetical protein CXF68_13525 [Tenacibaculum sp. Bg11-29]|nr:hypothetical protein CXF68_13525 [Tenacibaculum sp. Bg11-29]
MNSKGCISFGYIGLLILSINAFTIFSWLFMCNSLKDIYTVSVSENKYYAEVVSTTSEEHYNDESGEYQTMYTPTVKFTTNTGSLIHKELNFSTSNKKIGKTYKVHYDETNDTIITLGFTMIIKTVGAFIFCFVFSFLFIGLLFFILNHPMDNYKNLASLIGFYFFVPFLMIGFDSLLIYSIFYGNSVPFFVIILLLFFISILSLAIVGYIKMLLSEGMPKMKRAGPGKWVSR